MAAASPALKFVVMVGIMSFFADVTYEGSRITGPYLGLLGAGACVISVISGAWQQSDVQWLACCAGLPRWHKMRQQIRTEGLLPLLGWRLAAHP